MRKSVFGPNPASVFRFHRIHFLLACAAPLLLADSLSAAGAENVAPAREANHEPPPEAVIAAIPFEPNAPAARVAIDLAPAGRPPFVLMLDTGASVSLITPGLARKLRIPVRRDKSSEYRRATRLGQDLLFWIDTRGGDVASRSGWEVGILGAPFLSQYVVEIDYPGRVVRFLDREKYQVPAQASAENERVVNLRRAGTRLSVELEIEGRPLWAILDTGAPWPAVISGRAAKKLGVDVASLKTAYGMKFLAGSTEGRIFETERFKLAGFDFPLTPVLVAPRGLFNVGGSTDSLVGYDILRHFVLRLDYQNRRMWLRRAAQTPMTFEGVDYRTARTLLHVGMTEAEFQESVTQEEAERKRGLREDAVNRGRNRVERFEREQAKRLYVETPGGGWLVVDGYRLRAGPKDGEIWYSLEEMQRIRAERQAER